MSAGLKLAELTHFTYGTVVSIVPEQVFAVFFHPTMGHTVVVGPGSVAIPVTTNPEETLKIVNAAKAANQGES